MPGRVLFEDQRHRGRVEVPTPRPEIQAGNDRTLFVVGGFDELVEMLHEQLLIGVDHQQPLGVLRVFQEVRHNLITTARQQSRVFVTHQIDNTVTPFPEDRRYPHREQVVNLTGADPGDDDLVVHLHAIRLNHACSASSISSSRSS